MDFAELTDEQLAAAAAREDSDGPAFNALVARHQPRVWRVCYRLMGNEHDAHDAAQEVFVRLFLHRARFEGRSKYATWVHGIAIRTCLTLRRGRSRRARYEAAAPPEENAEHPDRAAQTMDLMQMLDSLEEDDRAMLLMKYAEGHSYEDLAEMFGTTVGACKMRVLRARQALQQRFPQYTF